MKKLQQKLNQYLGISFFELSLFLVAFITGTYFTFNNGVSDLAWYDWVLWIDVSLGIVAAIALLKKLSYSWILLSLDAMFYGAAIIGQGIYATGVINFLITPLLLSLTLITWKNHKDPETKLIQTRKLGIKEGLLFSLGVVMITALIGWPLSLLADETLKWRSWVDSFLAALTVGAFTFSVFRYREAWYLFFFSNTVKIIMFTILLVLYPTEQTSPLSLILAITYWLNAIYGMFVWRKSQKESIVKKFNHQEEVKK